MSNFSEILKDLLIENNINGKQLAKNINIQNSTIYKYLKGTLPRVENAVLLANHFNCSLNYLFGIDDKPDTVKFKKTFDVKLFYQRYEKLLQKENMSHFSLCKKIGLNISSLHAWKHGSLPYLDGLEKIARYFCCSIDYLIGRSDNL